MTIKPQNKTQVVMVTLMAFLFGFTVAAWITSPADSDRVCIERVTVDNRVECSIYEIEGVEYATIFAPIY